MIGAESEAGLGQVEHSLLLNLIMTAVYLYGTIVSKEDKVVFWVIVIGQRPVTLPGDLESLTEDSG